MDLLAKGVPDLSYLSIPPLIDKLTGQVSYKQSAIQDTTGISGGFKLDVPSVFKISAGFIYKEVVITTDTNATEKTITYLAIRGFMEVGGKKQEGPLLPGAPPHPT